MDKIGKYDLVREIGRGATATVYLGNDPFTQREVAIKVAFPEILKNPERGKLYTHLFLNEASLVGKLSHPHIVQIYDAVVAESLCYIVMEYVHGSTLEDFTTPDKLLPIERVVEIVFKCTRALDFAYRIGITHRDIKPANILFAGSDPNSGDIKISDFGAAIIDSPDRTQVSGIGSPAYMSPQQVREQALDHQTDIYSLGVVMYQLLTGQLPFQASTNYNIIYQIINSEPIRPSLIRKKIPEVLDAIVARAMSKDIRDRYQTWEEFAHDLAQAFRNKQLKAPKRDFAESEKIRYLARTAVFRRLLRRRDLGGIALLALEQRFARRNHHARRRPRRFFLFPRRRRTQGHQKRPDSQPADHRRLFWRNGGHQQGNADPRCRHRRADRGQDRHRQGRSTAASVGGLPHALLPVIP